MIFQFTFNIATGNITININNNIEAATFNQKKEKIVENKTQKGATVPSL